MDADRSSNVFQDLLLELSGRSIWSSILELRPMQFEDKSRELGRDLASTVVSPICRGLRYLETKDGISLRNDYCPSVLVRGTISLGLTLELIPLCHHLQGKFGIPHHDPGKADVTDAPAPCY